MHQDGWDLDRVNSAFDAWARLSAESYEIILFNIGMAAGDGHDLLQRLRGSSEGRHLNAMTPVLILTALDELSSRIAGLDMGADGYAIEPFEPRELIARMRAISRRAIGRAIPLVEWGELSIDVSARVVKRLGLRVELSGRESDIFFALLQATPRVLSRAQIEQSWCLCDRLLQSNSITVHIHHLRRKLGENVIQTIRGDGYCIPLDSRR